MTRRRDWLPVIVGIGIGVNTARLRGRLHALEVIDLQGDDVRADAGADGLGAADPSAGSPTSAGSPAGTHYALLTAPGIRLSAEQRRAATAHARRRELDVLDLVPARLPAGRVLDLARMVDPTTYRTSRLARGRSAGFALLVDQDLLVRAGVATADQPRFHARSEITDLTESEMVAAVQLGKRHAAASTDLAVLPGLVGPDTDHGAGRLALQRAAYAWEPLQRVLPALRDGAVLGGAAGNPAGAAAAFALSWLQPAVVGGRRVRVAPGAFACSPITRRSVAAARVRHAWATSRELATHRGSGDANQPVDSTPAVPGGQAAPRRDPLVVSVRPDPAAVARARPGYRAELAAGLDRFFEPAQTTCPWCGGPNISPRMRGREVAQGKPGVFRVDRCADCGHSFQNPRLSPGGLDFYYRDFYDGLGAAGMEEVFGHSDEPYLARARQPIPTPRNWLDVGGGHGHFCNSARVVWPTTRFDALDMGAGIEEAARRGWVDHAHRGSFPDLAGEVKGRYDVISMFHYLEHTRDPRAELDVAATVLEPGGHLLIEVPNPDSAATRWYGSLWPGWLIPQHQHLIPAANLVQALTERGFEVLAPAFGEVHQKGDPVIATYGLLQRLAPSPALPWREVDHPGRERAKRVLAIAALAPVFAAGLVVDELSRPYLTSGTRSNAYRILARRR
ncbi:class I SAM-dependent methyltransferase [Frankia sp. AgB32]|uniref:class I SAM-dependent methyltransferase n=1 Tax=Frankia sp. AgB32 TaxID=631119 RepID=UPI0027E2ADB4|nr:class I SAM-dependent methyltransferase [Frankia sp. AgB32]